MVIIRICGVFREHHGMSCLKLKLEADRKVYRFGIRLRNTPNTAGRITSSVSKIFECRARWRAKGRT